LAGCISVVPEYKNIIFDVSHSLIFIEKILIFLPFNVAFTSEKF